MALAMGGEDAAAVPADALPVEPVNAVAETAEIAGEPEIELLEDESPAAGETVPDLT